MSTGTIGDLVKKVRTDKSISLKDLSSMTNVSSSMISQIENNKVKSPSLMIIKKIADALDVNVSFLLGETPDSIETKPQYNVVRENERKTFRNLGEGLTLQILSTLEQDNYLEPSIHKIAPKVVSGRPPFQHEGQEFVIVLKGNIEVRLGQDRIDLKTGDACYFDANVKHSFKNKSANEMGEILCVCTNNFFLKKKK